MKRLKNTAIYLSLIINVVFILAVVFGIMAFFSVTDEARRARIINAIRFPIVKNIKSSKFIDSVKSSLKRNKKKLPVYNLKVSPEDLRMIQLQIQELTKDGDLKAVLTDDKKMWVKAIFQADKDYEVKIRIRGDLSNHWAYAKKSWRVKFKKEDLYKGYKQLDLILPKDKGYTTEAAGGIVARKNGLLVPDSWFASVSLNGVDMGAYLVMEKNSTQMLEKKGYMAGEIFSQENIWVQTNNTRYGLALKDTYEYFPASFKEVINDDEIDPIYQKGAFTYFLDLINKSSKEEFLKKIPVVLDIKRYLRWNAITWLFGTTHPHWGDNLRWYYDTTRGKFEPILYDTRPKRLIKDDTGTFESIETDRLAKRIIGENIEWRQKRNNILWEMINDPSMFLDDISRDLFNDIKDSLFKGVGAEYNFNALEEFKELENTLKYNRSRLKGFLSFARLFVQPYFDDGILEIEIMPDSLSKINIENLELISFSEIPEKGELKVYVIDPEGIRQKPEFRIGKKDNTLFIEFKDLSIYNRLDERLAPKPSVYKLIVENTDFLDPLKTNIKIKAKNSITDKYIPDSHLFVGSNSLNNHEEIDSFSMDIKKVLKRRDIKLRQMDDKRLILEKGEYTLKEDLIIPRPYSLEIEKGVSIRLYPDVNIIVYGALDIKGTEEEGINISSYFPESPFGVVASVNSKRRSTVSYLDIRGGSEVYYGGIFFSGQFCYYWSDVNIYSSVFRDAKRDDSLNIKNADVEIRDCLFIENSSDAFDGDFVRGVVENCDFIKNNGDGLDVSGALIKVLSSVFRNTADKGISVGEDSKVFVFNSLFTQNEIGIASKDFSRTKVLFSEFIGNTHALSAYQKKEIFGSAEINVYSSIFKENEIDKDVAKGSSIIIGEKSKDELETILEKETGILIDLKNKGKGNLFKPGRL